MVEFLEGLPLVTMGFTVIGGFIVFAAVIIFIQQRFYPAENLWDHLHTAGFIHAIIGIIYAVILGFIAVGVWERFDAAEKVTFDEAAQWQAIYQDASALSNGATIQKDIREYLEDVRTKEWKAMNSPGDSRDPDSATMANHIQHEIVTYNPKTPRETAAQQDMIAHLGAAMAGRNERTVAFNSGVNPAVWFVIFGGGFLTVAFALLIGFKRKWLQYLMLCTMSGVIGLAIFMTLALDFPFEGDVSVKPEAFESTIQNLDAYDKANGLKIDGPHGEESHGKYGMVPAP